jgi:hypothetical protein
MLSEVEPRRLLESLGPQLVPEDGNSDELVTDERSLQRKEKQEMSSQTRLLRSKKEKSKERG